MVGKMRRLLKGATLGSLVSCLVITMYFVSEVGLDNEQSSQKLQLHEGYLRLQTAAKPSGEGPALKGHGVVIKPIHFHPGGTRAKLRRVVPIKGEYPKMINSNEDITPHSLRSNSDINNIRNTAVHLGLQTKAVRFQPNPQLNLNHSHHNHENRDNDKPMCARADQECWRFQQLMKNWPKDKPKAAFYYLAKAARSHMLTASIGSVDNFFNDRFNYPIVIFHEANLIPKIPLIKAKARSDLYFQLVEFSIPSFLESPVKANIDCPSPVGYRHMCRFQAKLVYQEPILKDLEYYWRLDDDSALLKPVEYDVFKFMKAHDILYGYQWIHWDALHCTAGLWEATSKYITKQNITPHFFDEWRRPRLYYNNFEISKLSVWTSEQYSNYVDYLDQLGGIYYHRWGDAPIHGLAISLFVPKNKTHLFKDIAYQHGSFVNQGLNTFRRK